MSAWNGDDPVKEALTILELHHAAFFGIAEVATRTGHPVPMDTRGWSQILVSLLYGVRGMERQKGADLDDGSDVKAACTWHAIDTPRFNGVLKAGTKAVTSNDIASLQSMPHLFFVLWDHNARAEARCRIWVVQTQKDHSFRDMAAAWYRKRKSGEIKSDNFQLHPPRGRDDNVFRNTCGNLAYPKLFEAVLAKQAVQYTLTHYTPEILETGFCAPENSGP
ncbi:MamI family restriction endonuclease [Corallococcus exiguus]|uniref:MamI family restriction endonuclease n=1 Tax=Corallococcus exiguus TaxID=83462 RepID=UPI00155FE9FD|nr:MamI family restriction endonuclease [Corallococcus exiguus]NRD50858.1 MamI family restriction endonuclease [Corallococcus exiguus]